METEEIAIVGAGCRFPGADTLDEFWRVLVNGENHVKEIPLDRWNNEAFYDADKNVKGKSYVTRAGLLNNHDKWDNRLFGIGDDEATQVDPQQRYVLECVHMAMEDAGITRAQINGSNTGVMIGCMNDDYKVMLNLDTSGFTSYSATGMSTSVISARVAYVYNLHGACLTLDTACSSALVAIHLAGQALKSGDCDAVICGGVSSITNPDTFLPLCQAKMMSTVGQCQTFCNTADGYARGEGCGIVILKRLKDALLDGNKIWGVIQTGSNQDGCMTKPITAPSGVQQTKLLEQLYRTHHIDPSTIQYIEAHGTGTPRGDPTEINALGEFFVSHRKERVQLERPLLIGSVKSNIGHTESAAGIAGLLKILLMMKHGKIVPSLHVKQDKSNVNEKIRLNELDLDIAVKVEDWNEEKDQRTACLNSFGFGGSNAHAVIKQRPEALINSHGQIKIKIDEEEGQRLPVCLSAVDKDSLEQNLLAFKNDLENNESSLRVISHTSVYHRDVHPYRTVLFAENKRDLLQDIQGKIKKFQDIEPKTDRKVIFVFCGVGTTWKGMCQELMAKNDAFRDTIRDIDEFLLPLSGWKIGQKLSTPADYDDPFLNHIAIFSVQVGLSRMWKTFGIEPDAIVGQSVGEVAAACVANLLTLEEAVNIIYHRSRILAQQSVGTMMVVGNMDVAEIEEHCRKLGSKVTIAVYSSPKACTLSGHEIDIKELKQQIEEDANMNKKSVLVKELEVRCAYHSRLVEPCMETIKNTVDECLQKSKQSDINLQQHVKQIPLISTVTGRISSSHEIRTGTYWANNVRLPVHFMHGISESLTEVGNNLLIEIGPRPVLRAHLPAIMGDRTNAVILPSLLANRELSRVHSTLSELFEMGINLEWKNWIPEDKATGIAEIPRYIFKRSTDIFFPDKVKLNLKGVRTESSDSHMFMKKVQGSNTQEFEILINPTKTPFVYEHFLSGSVLVPGATYVETGFKVGFDKLRKPVNQFSVQVEFANTFTPASGNDYRLTVETAEAENGKITYAVKSENRTLATGKITDKVVPTRPSLNIEMLKSKLHKKVSKEEVYQALGDINFKYGPSLSLIQCAWASETECLVEIKFSEDRLEELISTHFHPAIVDAVFQMFGVLNRGVQFTVPKGVESITLTGSLEHHMYCYAKEIQSTNTSNSYNALLMSPTGSVIAEFKDFYTKAISEADNNNAGLLPYKLHWTEMGEEQHDLVNGDSLKGYIVVFTSCYKSRVLAELQSQAKLELVEYIDETTIEQKLGGDCIGAVYHVGQGPKGQRTGETIFAGTVKRFMDVKLILSVLSRRSTTIPFTVLTEKTQPISGRKEINIDGSELWGMKRAVFHEGLHENCKLVDIDPENVHVPTLANFLGKILPGNKEFQLVGCTMYETKLRKNNDSVPSSWKLNIDARQKMHLASSKPGAVVHPFFCKEEHRYSTETKESEMMQISLNVSVIHDSTVYLSTMELPLTDDTVWPDTDHEAEHQIITLEGQGKVLNQEKENMTDVIFCYPVSTATTVPVPQECIIRQEECLSYRSGLIIELTVLLNMLIALPSNSEVVLLNDSDKPGLCRQFCLEIAKERKISVTFFRVKDIRRKRQISKKVNIILTTSVNPANLELIFQKFTTVTEVVSTQALLNHDIQIWAQHKYPGTKITILKSGDMFSPNSLKIKIPTLRGYLRKVNISELGPLLYSLPMKEMNIHNMLQQKTTNFVCCRGNLFSERGCYILVGGLSGLGWELVKILSESGAGYVVPMSRRQPTSHQIEQMSDIMKTHGCQIHPLQADISDFMSVQRAFDDIKSLLPDIPIRGILHGAGVLSDTLLINLDTDKVKKVLTPKVLGTWNLHQASLDSPLDFFVMHSSIVSVIGNHGQCNYAAGNSFLDSFAAYRRSLGLPAKSLNWGALAVGMAADDPETEKALRSRGFRSLHTSQIRKFFIDSLMNDETNIVLADIDWDTLGNSPTFMSQKSKYESLMSSVKPRKQDTRLGSNMDFTKLIEQEPAKRQEGVYTIVKSIVNDVFVVDKNSITLETSLVYLGVDSMQAMSFSNKLSDVFGCQIPLISLLSEQTTLLTIVELIVDKIQTTTLTATDQKKQEDTNIKEYLDTNDGRKVDINYLFGSEDVTFMQIEILEKNRTKKTDPSQVRISDAELENLRVDLGVWKRMLKHLLQIHPELRRLYTFSDDGRINARMVPAESVKPDIVKVDMHSLTAQHAYDRKEDVTFDLSRDLPIRIRLAENETGTLFRIILHGIVADMISTAIICKDIERTMTCFIENTTLPANKVTVNIANVLKNAVKPKLQELHSFWSNYLDITLTPVSFDSPVSKPNGKYYELSSCLVPSHIVQQIQKYIGQRGLSLYHFVLSIYQLFLHIETGARLIPVGTAVDMRYHVPALRQAVTRCTNYIPVVATIEPGFTVDRFIGENSKNISKTTQHGAYPSLLIPRNLSNQEMRGNIFRHTIVMNDISALNGIDQTNKMKAIQSKLTFETFLRVKYDLRKQWIELECGFNSEIVGFQKGEGLPKDLVDLMDICLQDGCKTIEDVAEQREAIQDMCPAYEEILDNLEEVNSPDELPAPPYMEVELVNDQGHTNGHVNRRTNGSANVHVLRKDRAVLIEGEFLKQTSQGWDHRVTARLVENENEGSLVLEWCKSKSKRKWNDKLRSLDVHEMLQIKLLTLNGLSAILMKSPKRSFVMKTDNHSQAQQWMTEFTMAIQK